MHAAVIGSVCVPIVNVQARRKGFGLVGRPPKFGQVHFLRSTK